jgi:hypothetical protein
MGLGKILSDWISDQAERFGGRWLDFQVKVAARVVEAAVKAVNPTLWDATKKATEDVATMQHSASVRDLLSGKGLSTAPEPGTLAAAEWEGLPVGKIAIENSSTLAALVGAPLGLLPILMEVASGGLFPLARYQAANLYRPARLNPQEAITAQWRDERYIDLAHRDMADLGYSPSRINALADALRPILTSDQVRQLVLRGEDPNGFIEEHLTKAGYTGDDIKALKKLWQVIPPVQDLIRMAVREAFTPEIAEKFGQYQDSPDAAKEWASKIGLTEEWFDRYWAAHWDLPSVMQGMEMLHRGVIDQDTLNLLLRALDVMPYWRDKLTAIAYNPLTRVDVRRMYGLGVLDRAGVKRSYLDLGYNEENAERMTEFTVRYESAQDKDLTKAEILKAYRIKTLSADDTMEMLQELGYSEDDADFIMQTEDISAAAAERDLSETKIKQLYLTGLMPKLEVTANLSGLGYDATEIEYLYKLWDLEAGAAIQLPTRSELTHFWEVGVLSEDDFVQEMTRIGYPTQHISWYLDEFRADQVAAAQKEELRAQTEADRVAKASKTSQYERDRAAIDVSIAQANVFIAEAQRSLLQIGTAAEQKALRSLEARQRQALARLSVDERQQVARLSLELRIASRGATDGEKAVLERAALEDRETIENLSINERGQVAALALEESEKIRAEVSDRRTELQVGIAQARADIAGLQLEKARLKLSYAGP